MAALALRRSAALALDLGNPMRLLDPLQALGLPRDLARRRVEQVWDLGLRLVHAAGRRLSQGLDFLARAVPKPFSLVDEVRRQERAYAASDPKDLREMVANRAIGIWEVYTPEKEPLGVLQPVQDLELPGGQAHQLRTIPATEEAVEEACCELGQAIHGRLAPEDLFEAEAWFRAGYGLKPGSEDPDMEWPERLGSLVREGRELLRDRALGLAEHARTIQECLGEAAWREELRSKPPESPSGETLPERPSEPKRPSIPEDKSHGPGR